MSVFNDIVSILGEINQKLGENAGDKAKNIFPEEKVKEVKEGKDQLYNKNTSDIINGFKQALNSVPIFNKIHSALAGLSPLMDMIKGGIAHKVLTGKFTKTPFDIIQDKKNVLSKEIRDKGKEIVEKEREWGTSSTRIAMGPNESRKIKLALDKLHEEENLLKQEYNKQSNIQREWAKDPKKGKELYKKEHPEYEEKETKTDMFKRMSGLGDFQKGMDFFSNQFKVFKDNITKANFPRLFGTLVKPILDFSKLFKPGTTLTSSAFGIAFKKMLSGIGGGISGIAGAAGNLGAGVSMAGAGSALLGMMKLPLLLVGVAAGLLKLAKSIADSQRAIAQYSGLMSAAFAISDLRGMLRDMKLAAVTAPSTAKFLKAWNDMADEFLPIKAALINAFLELGTVLAKLTAGLLKLYNSLPEKVKEFVMGVVTLGIVPASQALDARNDLKAAEDKFKKAGKRTAGYLDEAEKGLRTGDKEAYENGVKMLTGTIKVLSDEIKLLEDKTNPNKLHGETNKERLDRIMSSNSQDKLKLETYKKDLEDAQSRLRALNLTNAVKEKSLQPKAEEKKKELEDKKEANAYKQTLDNINAAAKAAITYYTDQGAYGAGEFMLQAASWNFDPEKRRASEANSGLWSEAERMKRHGG
jgi:hypothetical protein